MTKLQEINYEQPRNNVYDNVTRYKWWGSLEWCFMTMLQDINDEQPRNNALLQCYKI